MKTVRGFIKYHSCIIFPALSAIIAYVIYIKHDYTDICLDKVTSLISISTSLIGVLITILTIYLTVPKNDFVKQRLKESKHERIYLYNILFGIIILFLSIMSWIFFDSKTFLIIFFIAGISNIAISVYYTFALIKLI